MPIVSYLLAMAYSKTNIDLYIEPLSCGAVRGGYKHANKRNVFLTVMMRMMTTMVMMLTPFIGTTTTVESIVVV